MSSSDSCLSSLWSWFGLEWIKDEWIIKSYSYVGAQSCCRETPALPGESSCEKDGGQQGRENEEQDANSIMIKRVNDSCHQGTELHISVQSVVCPCITPPPLLSVVIPAEVGQFLSRLTLEKDQLWQKEARWQERRTAAAWMSHRSVPHQWNTHPLWRPAWKCSHARFSLESAPIKHGGLKTRQ